MMYVYILMAEAIGNPTVHAGIECFTVQGVYSDYETCVKEMNSCVKSIVESHPDVVNYGEDWGLECSKGKTKKPYILYNDGAKMVYSIQERILDQLIYSSSVEP